MEFLGIDNFAQVKRADRNWEGIREFFVVKINELQKPGTSRLQWREAAIKVLENIKRQLSQIACFRDHLGPTDHKMKYTPLTNDACESQMAQLDVKVNYSGGAAPVETLSDKHILSVNGYLTSDEFSTKDLLKLMKWASTSKQATEMVWLQDEYL